MKIMSLNIWCGSVYEKLMPFLEFQKDDIDVFCFQEVFDFETKERPIELGDKIGGVYNIYAQMQALFTDFNSYFVPCLDRYGNAIFIRKNIEVCEYGTELLFEGSSQNFYTPGQTRFAQYVDIQHDGTYCRIINFHGVWTGGPKTDTKERAYQSSVIQRITEDSRYPIVVCGDFNLLPNTRSIQMLEDLGLVNWVVKNGITSTRSELYKKDAPRFADYIFTSKEVEVMDFDVLQVTVSDHLPLIIDIA